MPASTTNRASRASSSRVPIVDPTTRSCLKKILVSSALAGASPEVAPEMTTVPPGRRLFTECDQVAAPTVSITASTRSGRRAPLSNARSAPSATACSPLAASRLVTHIRMPAAVPSWHQRRRHPTGRALDEHGAARLHVGVREQHPVGREPRRRQARRVLPRQPLGLGDHVVPRHGDDLGQGAVVDLAEQAAPRVERLVPGPPRARRSRRARAPRCRRRRRRRRHTRAPWGAGRRAGPRHAATTRRGGSGPRCAAARWSTRRGPAGRVAHPPRGRTSGSVSDWLTQVTASMRPTL